MKSILTFLLNGEPVEIDALAPTTTLLNWLREERGLTGTKEGCAEGDCGACTVMVSELAEDGKLHHRAMNACILFLPALEGKSVTTVEAVADKASGTLHPVQQAMVDYHGSQCGFCTPGFVMSLFAGYRQGKPLDRAEAEDLLAGNLCRCTGYGSILAAATSYEAEPAEEADQKMLAALDALSDVQALQLSGGEAEVGFAPTTPEELIELLERYPEATLVAGATDVGLWVTKHRRKLNPVIFLNRITALKNISDEGGALRIGAGVTYAAAHKVLESYYPDLGELIRRIGAVQVREAGTIGGNIANGSPIGDTPPAFIALGATLSLQSASGLREIPLEDFFLSYGKQDLRAGEFVEAVKIPKLSTGQHYRCYKISKRFDQDISALCGCFNITLVDGEVKEARIAFGGMAGVPKRADAVESALIGKPWNEATIATAQSAFVLDFQPLSDLRASASYRLQVAENLLMRCYLETTGLAPSETRLVGKSVRGGA